jgi:hypothetical protein
LFSRRPRFVNADLRPESVVERKQRTKLLTDGSLRERLGSIVVGDVAQHTCLVHGLEAFNRVSERLLEFKDYFTRSGVPRQNLPRLLRLGGERPGEESHTRASQERATVYHRMTLSARSTGEGETPEHADATLGIIPADARGAARNPSGSNSGDIARARAATAPTMPPTSTPISATP